MNKYNLTRYSDNSITLEFKNLSLTLQIPKLCINNNGVYIGLDNRFYLYKYVISYNLELVLLGFGIIIELDRHE